MGTYTLDSNSTVDLSSIANGYVIADAVTILPAGTPPTVTAQGEMATWVLNQSGDYAVYTNWTAHANRATDAKYTIQHSGGSDTVTVNQQQNGGQWNLLWTYTLNQASQVSLSSAANGYVIADGIRLVPTAASNSPAGIFYVHNDHLGTPQVITDDNQTVVWKADYDPFGKATVTTEMVTNNVRFPGQYFDVETGLHYNYYRYYDPSTGRYITSDPIGLDGGINTYGYVGGNPLRYYDPYGLRFIANPWNRFQHNNRGRFSSLQNARNAYRRQQLDSWGQPIKWQDAEVSNLPDTSRNPPFGCPFSDPSCYYKMVCTKYLCVKKTQGMCLPDFDPEFGGEPYLAYYDTGESCKCIKLEWKY